MSFSDVGGPQFIQLVLVGVCLVSYLKIFMNCSGRNGFVLMSFFPLHCYFRVDSEETLLIPRVAILVIYLVQFSSASTQSRPILLLTL